MSGDAPPGKDAKAAAREKSAAAARAAAKSAPVRKAGPERRAGPEPAAEAASAGAAPGALLPEAKAAGSAAAARAAAGEPPILECERVRQRYPNPKGGYQVVLNGIDLVVPEHQFLSVVGPSGCGKSTLLRLILGSESPWDGAVRAGGEPIDHPDRRRGIVFQRYSLFPHLTVLDNVVFGLELDGTWLLQKWLAWPWYRRTHHKRYVEKAMEYLRTVKLAEHAGKYPHQLSGGMQQRVAIAQAMIMNPTILLMDEPFGALDPGTRESLQVTIVETFQQQKITVFFVTHDLEEALFVGERLLVLSPYYANDDGTPAEGAKLVMDIECPKARAAGGKPGAELQDLIAAVRRKGFDPSRGGGAEAAGRK